MRLRKVFSGVASCTDHVAPFLNMDRLDIDQMRASMKRCGCELAYLSSLT